MREWHTVTVASASISSSASGMPTTGLRPTTTARVPRAASRSAAAGVVRRARSRAQTPADAGRAAEIGRDAGRRRPWLDRSPAQRPPRSTPFGQRRQQQDAVDARRPRSGRADDVEKVGGLRPCARDTARPRRTNWRSIWRPYAAAASSAPPTSASVAAARAVRESPRRRCSTSLPDGVRDRTPFEQAGDHRLQSVKPRASCRGPARGSPGASGSSG